MKYFILLTFIIICFPAKQYNFSPKENKNFIPFNVDKKKYDAGSYSLYRAITSGNKKTVDRKIINIFKKYGFIHLLTPSGIHLSSIVFLFKFSKLFELLILFFSFLYVSKFQSYFSLERVIIFRIIQSLASISPIRNFNIETYFVLTVIISFLWGHYTESSMSLIYSILFWGTIITFRNNKFKLLIYLNISLFFISSLGSIPTSPLSIVINPFITGLISGVFPVLFLNQLLPSFLSLDYFLNFFFQAFTWLITFINNIDPFPKILIGTTSILLLVTCLHFRKLKVGVLILCLSMTTPMKKEKLKSSKLIVNLGDKSEILYRKNNWIHFIDQKCKFNGSEIFCKKKPSHLGGPVF